MANRDCSESMLLTGYSQSVLDSGAPAPISRGTGSSNPSTSSEASANPSVPASLSKKRRQRDPDVGGVIAGAWTSRRNARNHRPLIE